MAIMASQHCSLLGVCRVFTIENSCNDCQASKLTWNDVEDSMSGPPSLFPFLFEEFPDVGDVSDLRDRYVRPCSLHVCNLKNKLGTRMQKMRSFSQRMNP